MSGLAIFLLIALLIALLSYISWLLYTRLQARRLGLPAPSLNPLASFSSSSRGGRTYSLPSPRSSGALGWLTDKLHFSRASRNRGRTAGGAYEGSGGGAAGGGAGYGRAGRGGGGGRFAALDPDEAWDARVGNEADEAYYEEQELGLAGHDGVGGGGYSGLELGEREVDERYDEEMGRVGRGGAGAGVRKAQDPFGDQAERSDISLRGVSPRPIEGRGQGQAHKEPALEGRDSLDESPTERRSMFQERL